jgi:hypothetical protein
VAPVTDRADAYRVLVGIPEGKRPLGRPRLIWGGGGLYYKSCIARINVTLRRLHITNVVAEKQ